MSWPPVSDFMAMLGRPEVAFRDRRLQQARIEKNGHRQPRPWSGPFAVVFRAHSSGGSESLAVRVFTGQSPQRQLRYHQIAEHVRARKPDCLVGFEFHERGIRAINGRWYPLVVMDWVQGETLFAWTRRQCLSKDGPARLAAAARRWVELLRELSAAGIAHGDLQHGNILVTDSDRLKLVDYDGMCVPKLVGRFSPEVGTEPYQHPQRNHHTPLSLHLDHFSALVIYLALRALAADPRLWQTYVEAPSYDKLLFRKEDYLAPNRSALFRDLSASPDPEVPELAKKLAALAVRPIGEVPPLAVLAHSYEKVERLLSQRKWDEAVETLRRRGKYDATPEHLRPWIRQAQIHRFRSRAAAVYRAIPRRVSERYDRQRVDIWNQYEPLLAACPASSEERIRVDRAHRRIALVDQLHRLTRQPSRGTDLAAERTIVDLVAQLPDDYSFVENGCRVRIALARQRVEAVDRFRKATAEKPTEKRIVAAWQSLAEAESHHLVDPRWARRVRLARLRVPRLEQLDEMPRSLPVEQLDRRILILFEDKLLDNCREADPWRERYRQAFGRRLTLAKLEAAIRSHDEWSIAQVAADPCLTGYPLPQPWRSHVQTAACRMAQLDDLIAAMENRDRSSFFRLFDAGLIRQHADRLTAHHVLLAEWTRSEILSRIALLWAGLPTRPRAGGAVRRPPHNRAEAYRVRWTAPHARFTTEYILAICPQPPGSNDGPDDLPTFHRISVDRNTVERAGGSYLLHVQPDWMGSQVAVWAKINLGFQSLHTRPLLLGRLKRRWRWTRPWTILTSLFRRSEPTTRGARF